MPAVSRLRPCSATGAAGPAVRLGQGDDPDKRGLGNRDALKRDAGHSIKFGGDRIPLRLPYPPVL